MNTYFFVVYDCPKKDIASIIGNVSRGYLHTFTHKSRTMVKVYGTFDLAHTVWQSVGALHPNISVLMLVGGEIVATHLRWVPAMFGRTGRVERLHTPEKPKRYKKVRFYDENGKWTGGKAS